MKKLQAEADMEGAKRLIGENRSTLQLRPHLEAMTQQLAKLRKQYNGVYNSPNLSPEEKGQQLDRIRQMEIDEDADDLAAARDKRWPRRRAARPWRDAGNPSWCATCRPDRPWGTIN
jgi:hypothetical protein